MRKLSIIVAVFNEEATVRRLLQQVYEQPILGLKKELIIVESRSTDGTREICERFVARNPNTEEHEIKLILQDSPKGKGYAVREAFKNATGDIIMIQDGDLEYSVEDYPSLLQPILDGKTAFVLGSRHLSVDCWKIRQFERNPLKAAIMNFGGVFFHTFFNRVYGVKLTDPTTMYKVFKRECIEGMRFVGRRFDFDFELVGKLIRRGYIPIEVAVSYTSRGFEEGKKVRFFRDPINWMWAILRFRFESLT